MTNRNYLSPLDCNDNIIWRARCSLLICPMTDFKIFENANISSGTGALVAVLLFLSSSYRTTATIYNDTIVILLSPLHEMTRFPGFGYHVERGRRKNKCSGDHTPCYDDVMSMSVYKILFRQRMDNKIILIVFVVLAVKSFSTTPG